MKSILSRPAKMPCASYDIPAAECKTGSELSKIEGTVCHVCYAARGRNRFPNVQKAQYMRLEKIYHEDWVPNMVEEIAREGNPHFRWHSSGDLQSLDHLDKIAEIARCMPEVSFWLPTREKAIVTGWLSEGNSFPDNLTVRVSGAMIDGPPPRGFPITSTVVTDPKASNCPATTVRSTCDDCRQCWDKEVKNVAYLEH